MSATGDSQYQMTTIASGLAVLGALPAFSEPLHVGRPNIGDTEAILGRLRRVLESRWLTNDGPCVRELEARIAEDAQVAHCVAMCNGTVALEVAIRALGMHGEVIVPSFTFVATAHALAWQGITPVFADVDRSSHTLDPEDVARRITPRTTGIIGVHLWGRPRAIDELAGLARQHGLRLMFDAAHAFHSTYRGRMIGGFGDAEVYSFHATKFFNTFEGGAVLTNDAEVARKLRLTRNFGFEGYDNVTEIGTNGKMTEVCAAMGLESLVTLPSVVQKNRENYEIYRRELSDVPGLSVLESPRDEKWNYQYVVVGVTASEAGLTRDELVRALHADNILARRYFTPGVHRMVAYTKASNPVSLPNTEWLADRILCLPTGTAVTDRDVVKVCRIIQTAIRESSAVRDALRA